MRAADSPGGCVGNGVEAGGPWTERDRPEAVTDVQARSEETWTELSSERGAGRGRRRASWAHRRRATRRTWTGRWAAGRRAPLASPGREMALGLVTGRRVSARHASGSSQRLCGPALWRQDKDPGTILLGVLPTPDGFQVCSLDSLSGNDSFLPGQREPATSVPPWSLHWHSPGSRGGQVEVPGLRGPGRPSPDTASPPSPPQLCSARPPPSRAVGPCARPARPAPSAGTGTTALRGPWEVPGPGATSTSRFSPRAGPSARWAAETPATMMFRKSFQRPGKTMILCRGRKVRKPNLRDRVAEGDPSCKRRGCRAPRRARPRRTALLVARDCGPRSLFPAPCVVSVTSRIT